MRAGRRRTFRVVFLRVAWQDAGGPSLRGVDLTMRVMLVLISLALAGCQSGAGGFFGDPGAPARSGAGGSRQSTDDGAPPDLAKLNAHANMSVNSSNSGVIRLAAGLHIGEIGTTDDQVFGGRVSVHVTEEFTAASGRRCREFTVRRLTVGAEANHYVACFDGGDWFYVNP